MSERHTTKPMRKQAHDTSKKSLFPSMSDDSILASYGCLRVSGCPLVSSGQWSLTANNPETCQPSLFHFQMQRFTFGRSLEKERQREDQLASSFYG